MSLQIVLFVCQFNLFYSKVCKIDKTTVGVFVWMVETAEALIFSSHFAKIKTRLSPTINTNIIFPFTALKT